eukprot:175134-Chlamydomonas_euryale.AAC.1
MLHPSHPDPFSLASPCARKMAKRRGQALVVVSPTPPSPRLPCTSPTFPVPSPRFVPSPPALPVHPQCPPIMCRSATPQTPCPPTHL